MINFANFNRVCHKSPKKHEKTISSQDSQKITVPPVRSGSHRHSPQSDDLPGQKNWLGTRRAELNVDLCPKIPECCGVGSPNSWKKLENRSPLGDQEKSSFQCRKMFQGICIDKLTICPRKISLKRPRRSCSKYDMLSRGNKTTRSIRRDRQSYVVYRRVRRRKSKKYFTRKLLSLNSRRPPSS